MKAEDYQFFQQSGYLPLGRILTDEELEFYLRLYDRDRDEKKAFALIMDTIIKRRIMMCLLVLPNLIA